MVIVRSGDLRTCWLQGSAGVSETALANGGCWDGGNGGNTRAAVNPSVLPSVFSA